MNYEFEKMANDFVNMTVDKDAGIGQKTDIKKAYLTGMCDMVNCINVTTTLIQDDAQLEEALVKIATVIDEIRTKLIENKITYNGN